MPDITQQAPLPEFPQLPQRCALVPLASSFGGAGRGVSSVSTPDSVAKAKGQLGRSELIARSPLQRMSSRYLYGVEWP